jgi:hypothetical protein
MAAADGQRVTYLGETTGGLAAGDEGKVLAGDEMSAHVLMHTGSMAGQVVLVSQGDLEPQGRSQDLVAQHMRDSLALVLEEDEGEPIPDPRTVATSLASQHEDALALIGDQVLATISAALHTDTAFTGVLASLDDAGRAECVQEITASVLRDLLESMEGQD